MEKHPYDIGKMLLTQGDALDFEYIRFWVNEIGAQDIWEKILTDYHRRRGEK